MESWYYRLREQQWRTQEREQPERAGWLRALDALYLFGTIGIEAVLRSDGEVWVLPDDHWDDPSAPEPEWRRAEDKERTSALVIASKRMPELRALLPARPANSLDCPRCAGTGYFYEGIVCPDCGALGWFPVPAT